MTLTTYLIHRLSKEKLCEDIIITKTSNYLHIHQLIPTHSESVHDGSVVFAREVVQSLLDGSCGVFGGFLRAVDHVTDLHVQAPVFRGERRVRGLLCRGSTGWSVTRVACSCYKGAVLTGNDIASCD